MKATDWSVWQDAAIATAFTNDRRGGIMGAREQINVMLELLPPRPAGTPRVLDIGCGDGILLESVLRHWSGAQGVALDGSPAMLEQAAERLSVFHPSAVTFIQADFNAPDWRNALPLDRYHAIVSGFAIHHSEDERKRALYSEIYDLLDSGGVFVNIEHVASASPLGEDLFERAYAKNIVRHRRERGDEAIFEDVLQEIHTRLDKSANRLTPVETQVQWLRDIGYTDADCYWKHYELAIFAGYKR
jgi:tRNA (cmo5U34)-methyltransferase